jgi:hypothetical protein
MCRPRPSGRWRRRLLASNGSVSRATSGDRSVAVAEWLDTWIEGSVTASARARTVEGYLLDRHRILQVAGVRPARLHDARHTAATLLLVQGVPASVAMRLLDPGQAVDAPLLGGNDGDHPCDVPWERDIAGSSDVRLAEPRSLAGWRFTPFRPAWCLPWMLQSVVVIGGQLRVGSTTCGRRHLGVVNRRSFAVAL